LVHGGPAYAQTAESSAAEGAASTAGQEKPSIERELEEAFWRGEDLFTQGKYDEAAISFTRALELSQRPEVTGTWRDFSPKIALNVAQSHRRAGNCEAAEMAYTHYAAVGQPLPKEHIEWHEALLAECPGLHAGAPADGDSSNETGKLAASNPTGASKPEASSEGPPGSGSWLLDVNADGVRRDARVAVDGETKTVWGWTAAGASVASLGAALGFWISGNQQSERAEGKRLWADAEPLERSATTRWTIAGVCAGAGLVLGGVSVYLFTRSAGYDTASRAPRLGLHTSGTELHLTGTF
jgi:hypothetical protein